ncbi:hypothetical protein BGX23_000652 [Mortierella sp. AD031]|nr:hypothetical protein BGX23_000652 [Mortierella sp. AD031]KAG0219190.1 hypothetical protein BGX33_004254 [Mortierella sp. NVP41]
MTRLFSKVTALATLAIGLLSTTEAVGSAANYTGSLCKNYVNYEIWMPPNVTVDIVEAGLLASGLTADAIQQIPASCLSPFIEYVCSSSFPRIVPRGAGAADVLFTCKSTCQKVVAQCAPIFQAAGKPQLIPDCDAAILSTLKTVPPNGILFQPDGACNMVQPLTAPTPTNQTTHCPPPFLPQKPGMLDSPTCSNNCCVPCPAQYHLYREGALDKGFRMTNTMRAVSMVFSFILMISYLCLPDKRSHPSALILLFAMCVFLFSVVVIFPLIDTNGMQCFDEYTPSTQQNNLKCAVQGAMLIFASVSTCAWCSALIVNLHLHTVWNSAWLAKKYWLLHTICWGFAITVTAVALGTGQIRWEFATLCLISQEKSSTIFFYPMAAMIFPAFLIHIATFFHIARISAQAGIDSETMSRSTLSASAAAVISHRRHVMMAIKIQWRAAVMAVCALLSVTFYWLFYFLQLSKINPKELAPYVQKFGMCLATKNSHDFCADELAPHLPPYGLMIAAEFLVSSIGTVIFIVFFKMALVREWGEWFSSIGYLCSGKRRQKQEQDQFFVI